MKTRLGGAQRIGGDHARGERAFSSSPLRGSAVVLVLLVGVLLVPSRLQAGTGSWIGFWLTPDQQGQRHYGRGDFAKAAQAFRDPMWQGVAWYRAGEFEKAARAFGRRETAEAHFNQGNAWLMHGQYESAIANYDRALAQRPEWPEARANRELAVARAKRVEQKGGDMGDQQLGADEIVFDKNAKNEGQETQIAGEQAISEASVQAMWLRRVQTKPADFLKAKFAYQQATEPEGAR